MFNKLNINKINQYFVDNIEFLYIAYPGCLGLDGTIKFLLKDGNAYSCNVIYEDEENYIDYELLKNKLLSFNFDLDLHSNIKGYESLYLGGCGNYLFIKPKYALDFYRFSYGMQCSEIFKKWYEFSTYILCTQNGTS